MADPWDWYVHIFRFFLRLALMFLYGLMLLGLIWFAVYYAAGPG